MNQHPDQKEKELLEWLANKHIESFPTDQTSWTPHLKKHPLRGDGSEKTPFVFDNGDELLIHELIDGRYWHALYWSNEPQSRGNVVELIMRYGMLEVPKTVDLNFLTRMQINLNVQIPFTTEDYLEIIKRRRP